MHRQKGRIVNVEIPYATKVLTQELSAITNITLRFITSGDTARLRPFEEPKEGTRVIKPLKQLELPEFVQSEELPEVEKQTEAKFTLAELAQYGLVVAKAKQEQIDAMADLLPVADEDAEITQLDVGAVIDEGGKPVSVVASPGASNFQLSPEEVRRVKLALSADGSEEETPIQRKPVNTIINPLANVSSSAILSDLPAIGSVKTAKFIPAPVSGLPPTISIPPAEKPVLVVDTGQDAMMDQGLAPLGTTNASQPRTLRRANVGNLSVVQQAPTSSATGPITVRKLGADGQ
jgi:hypothetical protein